MKAFEFTSCIAADKKVAVPAQIASQLADDQSIRVILLVPEGDEESDWARLTSDQCLAGYAEGDAIYDELPTR